MSRCRDSKCCNGAIEKLRRFRQVRARPDRCPRWTGVAFALVLGWAAPAPAQSCIDYQDYMHWAGGILQGGYDVAVAGSYAYLLSEWDLRVLDVSNPLEPVEVGGLALAGLYGVPRVHVSGSHAFVCGSGELDIVDVTDPAAPSLVTRFDTPGGAFAATVSGTTAYVADGASGLQVIDVSNPSLPVILGTADTPGSAQAVALAGSLACVADGPSGLQVIDVSIPTAPILRGGADTPTYAKDVAVSGTHALIADGWPSNLQIFDISVAASPVLVGHFDGYANRVAARGARAFLLDFGGLEVVDFSDAASPQRLGRVSTPGYGAGLALSDSEAFVADAAVGIGDATWGLRVIDISTPFSPAVLDRGQTSAPAGKVAVAGELAFVTEGAAGLQVIHVGASPPVVLGGLDTPGLASDVAVSGNHAYVADGDALCVIEVSNPAAPSLVATLTTTCESIALAENRAYVVGDEGLQVIDVSIPGSPVILGSIATPGAAVAVRGNLACVVGFGDFSAPGFQVVDVSDPRSPVLVGSSGALGKRFETVAMFGSYAYATFRDWATQGDTYSYLRVFDLSNPSSPAAIRDVVLSGYGGSDIAIAGVHAYVADAYGDLEVFDISRPGTAHRIGSVPLQVHGIAVSGERVYCAAGGNGLLVLPAQCVPVDAPPPAPEAFRRWTLLPAAPNPTRGETNLQFEAAAAGDVALQVFDVAGHRLRNVLRARVVAGRYSANWDGRDGHGNRLGCGVYVVRLVWPGGSTTRRITFLH
jgi:hypothetical protein